MAVILISVIFEVLLLANLRIAISLIKIRKNALYSKKLIQNKNAILLP